MRLRLLVSAVVLSLAALVPAIAPAQAAHHRISGRTWNRLAGCESGRRWHIDTGNGYYGGLQISLSTWRGYGGRHFARLPSRATRKEQIKVARRIKRHQGWGAWPACSSRLGLR